MKRYRVQFQREVDVFIPEDLVLDDDALIQIAINKINDFAKDEGEAVCRSNFVKLTRDGKADENHDLGYL